jgi:hypothetical protein
VLGPVRVGVQAGRARFNVSRVIEEQVQTAGPPAESPGTVDVAPVEVPEPRAEGSEARVASPAAREARAGPERLAGLLARAAGAEGEGRRAAAGELNAALDRAGRHPSRGLADLLLRWLDQGDLDGLEDAEGRSCRAAAVEALLSMGYPFALEVRPEDLEHLRERAAAGGSMSSSVAALLLVAITSGFAGAEVLLGTAWQDRAPQLMVLAAALLSILAAVFTRPRGRGRRIALVSLLITGLMSLGMAVTDSSVLLMPALGAIAAFAMVWPRRRPPAD